jgi:hypothetical protein
MDFERVKQSLERTCENVLYVSVGQFDVRLELAGARLEVKVFPLCGEGDALAVCAASSEEVCRGCPAGCEKGDVPARLAALEVSTVAARGSAAQEVANG